MTTSTYRLPGHLKHYSLLEFGDYIENEYDICVDDVMSVLFEDLIGICFKNERPSGFDPVAERAKVYKSAKQIASSAKNVVKSINLLRKSIEDFTSAMGDRIWSVEILCEVFNVNPEDFPGIEIPKFFEVIYDAAPGGHQPWEEVIGNAQQIAEIPIRPKRRTNKVRNHALEQALLACRRFWEEHRPDKKTARGNIRFRDEDQPGNLKGEYERFVDDMLTAAGFEYTMQELNGAWGGIDKRRSRAKKKAKKQ